MYLCMHADTYKDSQNIHQNDKEQLSLGSVIGMAYFLLWIVVFYEFSSKRYLTFATWGKLLFLNHSKMKTV